MKFEANDTAAGKIQTLAITLGIKPIEVIRRALAVYACLHEEHNKG